MAADQPSTRDRTLDAAAQLLRDEGPGALSVRRIASAAGLSTMAIYHHFGGKDGLVEALYEDGFRALEDALAAAPRTTDPLADVETLALAYREIAISRPGYYEVMFGRPFPGFAPTPEMLAKAMRPWRAFAEALERCEAAGLLTIPATDAALLLWSSGHGLLMLQLAGNQLASDTTNQLVRSGIHALLAAVTHPSALT
ncbi:MAG: TetR/AcrR family transcriptional regulator [Patulibacter sp.]